MSADQNKPPKHLGLILDGNRRWARANGKTSAEGHKQGYRALKDVGLAALEAGVEYVSAYTFSTENWSRSKDEVTYLMNLVKWVVEHEIEEFHKKNIRVRIAGTQDKLSKSVIKAIERAENLTKDNTGGTLVLCFNYGGHQEIVDAVNKIITQGKGALTSVEDFEQYLYTPEVPPIDIVVRSSGEQRLSNFMLWRVAYSEIMFIDKMWPDFDASDVPIIIEEFNKRQRRFGA